MSAGSLDNSVRERPLADAINAATRSLHTELNGLILARLPLIVPPHAADPTSYLSGLLHVAPIYIAFEELWLDVVEHRLGTPHESPPVGAQYNVAKPPISDRLHSILASLYIPGLVRSDRMRADIASLTGLSPQLVEERLRSVTRTGHLAAFVDHIRRVVSRKPHVLVAYTYILFMALFAGGRFIRATLESAGRPFWESQSDMIKTSLAAPNNGAKPGAPAEDRAHHHRRHHHRRHHESTRDETLAFGFEFPSLPPMPLRFLHFNAAADGEDLKGEYKQKLSESEASLTHSEKKDIVQEGICIFENMIRLIHQLDTVCAAEQQECSWSLDGLRKSTHVVGDRFRDSIAVTRQRWERSSAKESPGSEPDVAKAAKARTHPTRGSDPTTICPSSKSVRFDGAPPHPDRCLQGSAARHAPRQDQDASVSKWLLATVLGILTLGVLFISPRGLLDWSRV